MQYTLMHKEQPILSMELDEITGGIVATNILFSPEHLPVGIAFAGNEVDRADLNHWWLGRSIPASRSGMRQALEQLQLATPHLLLVKCFGLSLSDQYWVRPAGQEPRWADINFFDNDFSEDVGNILFGSARGAKDISLNSPDNTSDGQLKKRWKLVDGVRCLIKGGSAPFFQEPLNEVFASTLMDKLGIDHVPYRLLELEDQPYSVCPDFVTANTELVTAHSILKTCPMALGVSKYQHFLQCCQVLGIPDIRPALDRMLTVDFLIANEDRHNNNFGMLRNADTLEWIGFAPIYDCGTSLWFDNLFRWNGPALDGPNKPFAPTHGEQIKLVQTFDWLDYQKLTGLENELRKVLMAAARFISEERCETICEGFADRCKQLMTYAVNRVNAQG